MELHEALKIIDATSGMLTFFLGEVQLGELKEKFLLTPVLSTIEEYYDENFKFCTEKRDFYTYTSEGKECKGYIVDVSPACNCLINEWPSPKAKKIRKILEEVCFNSIDDWKSLYGESISAALEEGYDYNIQYTKTHLPRTIESVIFETLHEMFHALGLTEFDEDDEDDNGPITEETASKMDWVRLTDRFDLEKIKEVVKNTGKSNEEKRIVVKAIFDALMSIDKLYNIPYSVDKLILQLYLEYGGQRQDLSPTKDKKTKSKPAKSKIPDCLTTPEAEKIWERLRKAGFIIKDGYSLVKGISQNQATYIASCMADKLGIQKKWKTFKQLWNINNMAQMAGSWKQTGKVPPRAKEIRDLM